MKPYALTLSMVVLKTLIYKKKKKISLQCSWVRRLFPSMESNTIEAYKKIICFTF